MTILLGLYRIDNTVAYPTFGTTLSTCFDLRYHPTNANKIQGYTEYNDQIDRQIHEDGSVDICPGDRMLIPTGVIFKIIDAPPSKVSDVCPIPTNKKVFSIRLHPRSGMALKSGLVLANAEGIVDIDYQKQVFVIVHNISRVRQKIMSGERIAQAEILKNEQFMMTEFTVEPSGHSERSGGFGSTGKN